MTLRTCAGIMAMGAMWSGAVAAQTLTPPARPLPPAYDSGGRRDPFVSLIGPAKKDVSTPATAQSAAAVRPVGTDLASLSVTEVSVKGILKSGSTILAILEGPGGRSFLAKRDDRLLNGAVKSIEADAVVFAENVADAQGRSHTRDVRRLLHPQTGGGR